MDTKDTYVIGAQFKNNQGYNFEIIELNCDGNRRKVRIRFLDTYGTEVVVYDSTIRRGTCSNPYHKSVYGVGFTGVQDKHYTKHPSYRYWVSMIARVHSEIYHKVQPTYKRVTICKEWYSYEEFKKWFCLNYPNNLVGESLEMDKDMLQMGVEFKEYSPNTVVFLPKRINIFLSNKHTTNTSGHIGVSLTKDKKWRVQINDFNLNKIISLGRFDDKEEASKVYKLYREKNCEYAKDYLRSLNYLPEEIIQLIKTVQVH